METLVDSGVRVCTGLQYFPEAASSSASRYCCVVLQAHLAVRVQRILPIAVAVAVQVRSSGRLRCLQTKQPLCKDSCLARDLLSRPELLLDDPDLPRGSGTRWASVKQQIDWVSHICISCLVIWAKSDLESGQLLNTYCCIFYL